MPTPRRRQQNRSCWNRQSQNHTSSRAFLIFCVVGFVTIVFVWNNLTHLGDVMDSKVLQAYQNQAAGGNGNNNNNNNKNLVVTTQKTEPTSTSSTTDNVPSKTTTTTTTPENDPSPNDSKTKKTDNPENGGPTNGAGSKNDVPDISKLDRREQYALFKADVGILSDVPFETYLEKHKKIDAFEHSQRCRRFGYSYSAAQNRNRRVFYGTILADEPWEMLEILSAEYYGMFYAMVFVEPTRDYYGNAREPLRLEALPVLQSMFGIDNIRIVKYENDDSKVKGDLYLDMARNQIVQEWINLGMVAEDVAHMTNIDEMFARDYLNAIKYCETPEFKYELHRCVYNRVKTFGQNQVYETSPECVSRTKTHDHPEVMIAACLEGVGNTTINRLAPRDETGVNRAKGWSCEDRTEEEAIKDQTYPLWSGADFRSLCGGKQTRFRASMHQNYAAFHFRNFFNTVRDMRLKHTMADKVYDKSLDDLGEDMRVTYRCLKDIPDEQDAVTKREPGGFAILRPMTPLYLADEKYRKSAHERAQKKVLEDEKKVKSSGRDKQDNVTPGLEKNEKSATKKS